MKLLMISGDRMLAAGKAGAFLETLSELCKHFERIDILCPSVRSSRQVRVLYDNVYIHPSSRGLWYQPFWILKKGRELFQAHHHDVMTVHDYPPFYNGIGARLLKRKILRQSSGQVDIPAVLEIHHIVGWPKASSLHEYIGRILSRVFLASHIKHFALVRVVNETVQRLLVGWGAKPEAIRIVPSVYLDRTSVMNAKNAEKKFDLVFAARLVHNKGLMQVIRAVGLLPKATLLVIGDGPVRHRAEMLVRSLGISSRVTFAGWLPTAQNVLPTIASGRLLLMNSRSEGNPRVAIEAMALGVPVLATRVGIMPDVIVDGINGMFTDGSSKDIAAKARALLADEAKLQRMASEAANIADRFEKTSAIRNYAEFLKSIAH